MGNFDETNQESIAHFVISHMQQHSLLALGTVNSEGYPWLVCLNLYFDPHGTIYWKSQKSAEHSKNIERNPHVSICVFSRAKETGDFGFYSYALAHEMKEDELHNYMDLRYTKNGEEAPDSSIFLGESTNRVYCAQLTEAWVNDERHIKQRVDLDTLRKAASHHEKN